MVCDASSRSTRCLTARRYSRAIIPSAQILFLSSGAVRDRPPAGERSRRTAERALSPRGKSSPRARAYRALQRARPWTLPELAQRCNMSRATFIRHFQVRLGRSASDLLTDIRMTVAANALKTSDNVDRRRRRGFRLPIRGRVPARVQAPNGHHARPVAKNAVR
jgi:AraC-like DNA-binding protein